MKIQFRVTISYCFFTENSFIRKELPEMSDGVILVSDCKSLQNVLDICRGADFISVSSLSDFSDSRCDEFDFFALGTTKSISLLPPASNANDDIYSSFRPMDKGGWSPVFIPDELFYATKAKNEKDIVFVARGELAVSKSFFDVISKIDNGVVGKKMYTSKKRSNIASDVFLLSTEKFSDPCLFTSAVGRVGSSDYCSDPEKVEGLKNFIHLGVPVVPASMVSSKSGIMRSAEPWGGKFSPGWVVDHDVAETLSRASKDVAVYPLLTEGTTLHKDHEELWSKARKIVASTENAEWEDVWSFDDFSNRFRK